MLRLENFPCQWKIAQIVIIPKPTNVSPTKRIIIIILDSMIMNKDNNNIQACLAIQHKNVKFKLLNTAYNQKFNKDCMKRAV